MRIDYLAFDRLPSRAANVVYGMAMLDAFARLGHEVHASFPRDLGADPGSILDDAAREHELDPSVRLRFLPRLEIRGRLGGSYFAVAAAKATFERPDLVVTQTPRIAELVRASGLSVVLDLHGEVPSDRGRRALARLARRRDRVGFAFNTARLREVVERDLGRRLEPAVVWPNGVRLARFPGLDRDSARHALGLGGGLRLVHAGHAYPGRGVELLIALASRRPELTVVQVGGEPRDLARLRADVSARGLRNVEILDHVAPSELPTHLAAADVLAMPYTADAVVSDGRTKTIDYASPMKMIDFLAAGRPIVASRFPGIAETLRDGVDSLLVPPDSVDAIDAAVGRILGDPALSAALAIAARERSRSLDWTSRAGSLIALARRSGLRA